MRALGDYSGRMDTAPHLLGDDLLGQLRKLQPAYVGQHVEASMHVRVELQSQILAFEGHTETSWKKERGAENTRAAKARERGRG